MQHTYVHTEAMKETCIQVGTLTIIVNLVESIGFLTLIWWTLCSSIFRLSQNIFTYKLTIFSTRKTLCNNIFTFRGLNVHQIVYPRVGLIFVHT